MSVGEWLRAAEKGMADAIRWTQEEDQLLFIRWGVLALLAATMLGMLAAWVALAAEGAGSAADRAYSATVCGIAGIVVLWLAIVGWSACEEGEYP